MNIEEEKKSKVQFALDNGSSKVGNQERKIATATRKTKDGKERQAESEENRRREEALIKATLKEKSAAAKDGDDDDEGWESVEEDYPHIKLDDLKDLATQLAGMNIEGGDDDEEDDEEDLGENSGAAEEAKKEKK